MADVRDLARMFLEEQESELVCGEIAREFMREVDKAKPVIDRFCKKSGVIVVNVGSTAEGGFYEPTYSFSDNTGNYTIDGVRNSL